MPTNEVMMLRTIDGPGTCWGCGRAGILRWCYLRGRPVMLCDPCRHETGAMLTPSAAAGVAA
jgi:hypothetical protein